MKDIIQKKLSYTINGIFFDVHNELGHYKNEKQYCDKIEYKLIEKNLNHNREFILPESFVGEHKNRNRVDFIINSLIILEIKAKRFITKEDYYQLQRYLNSLNIQLGIIVNFRDQYLKPKRIINANFK